MDIDTIRAELVQTIQQVQDIRSQIESRYEHFIVALSGTLRLLSGTAIGTLDNLQGNPEAIKGYITSQTTEMQTYIEDQLDKITESLKSISDQLE